MRTTVAVLGTRYPDLSIERDVLGSDVSLVSGPGADAESIVEVARSATVIIAGSAPLFTPEVIGELRKCQAIVRAGIGVESVDLEAADSAGIWVVNVPDYGTEAVALHTIALSLAALRRLFEADSLVRSGTWSIEPISEIHMPDSMTAGVVGFGRIGRRVAGLFDLLGFRNVLAHDPHVQIEDPGVEASDLDALLQRSNLVSLHAPSGLERHLISSRELELMSEGSILVNTARGSLVDGRALAKALARGVPRFAALDVFEGEPPDLSAFDSVSERMIFTPHMAWYSVDTQRELRTKAAEEARAVLGGERPQNAVVVPGGIRP